MGGWSVNFHYEIGSFSSHYLPGYIANSLLISSSFRLQEKYKRECGIMESLELAVTDAGGGQEIEFIWSGKTIIVTRCYKTDPNCTSGTIKLTPPVDSYTIVLLALTLSTQTTRGWFFNRCLFWVVWSAQMAVSGLVENLAWQQSVVYWWTAL